MLAGAASGAIVLRWSSSSKNPVVGLGRAFIVEIDTTIGCLGVHPWNPARRLGQRINKLVRRKPARLPTLPCLVAQRGERITSVRFCQGFSRSRAPWRDRNTPGAAHPHYGRAADEDPRMVEAIGTDRLTRLSRERGHAADAGRSTNTASPLSLLTYQRSGSAPLSSNTRQHHTSPQKV